MAKKSALKSLLDSNKVETQVVGPVERHLLKKSRKPSTRRSDVIHPSEMAKKDWCHRATYYRIAGATSSEVLGEDFSFPLERIFEEGHLIHSKWQKWLWEMKLLRGIFKCRHCNRHFEATAPDMCPHDRCYSKALEYVEVPVYSDEHLIAGHSDGDIGDALIEIKSIGMGSIRFENPQLLGRHTHEVDGRKIVDIEGVWKDIKRPFPSHIIQGMIYCFCTGKKKIVFIYEFKANQQAKEFVVKFDQKLIDPLLEACLDIKHGLETGNPPPCPIDYYEGCEECKKYERGEEDNKDSEPGTGEGDSLDSGESTPEEREPEPPATARLRRSRSSSGSRRVVRRSSDGDVRRPNGLGGLLEHSSRDAGDR